MEIINRGVKGGIIAGFKSREKSLNSYYSNPNYCLFCSEMIKVNVNEKVQIAKKKKFCNKSCAASYNNSKRIKIEKIEKINRGKKLTLVLLDIENSELISIGSLSKGELLSRHKTYQSFRSMICKNARRVFKTSGKERKCFCGYDKHTDIAHKKPVSEFDNNAKISEINSINNLIPLCKNHHWEFDNGFLNI